METQYGMMWKSFPGHLVGAFKELRDNDAFADVTLVSDDQIQTRAHKIVLSACSPVMKTLLVKNPHSHPLLYMRGIKNTELQAILSFMYFGESQINTDRFSDFMSVALDLQVKEICNKQNLNETQSKLSNLDFMVPKAEEVTKSKEKINTKHGIQDKELTFEFLEFEKNIPNETDEEDEIFVQNETKNSDEGKLERDVYWQDVRLWPPPASGKRKKASVAWRHGGFVKLESGELDREFAICSHCGKKFRNNGSPAHLMHHLKQKHSNLLQFEDPVVDPINTLHVSLRPPPHKVPGSSGKVKVRSEDVCLGESEGQHPDRSSSLPDLASSQFILTQ